MSRHSIERATLLFLNGAILSEHSLSGRLAAVDLVLKSLEQIEKLFNSLNSLCPDLRSLQSCSKLMLTVLLHSWTYDLKVPNLWRLYC